jgi:hypothetical protein
VRPLITILSIVSDLEKRARTVGVSETAVKVRHPRRAAREAHRWGAEKLVKDVLDTSVLDA